MIVVLALLAWGTWYWLDGRWYASTNDAYAHANIVEVTPLVPGTVTAIDADNNDYVRAGQTLVQFDAADARVALERAEANLALTVRRVRALYAGAGAAQALLATRQVELRRAEQDYARVLKLKGTGAISAQDAQHAGDALAAARAALGAAREQLNSSRAPIAETVLARQPDVLMAAAMLRQAYLDLARTRLLAPVSGYIAKRSVQLGQRVMPGTPLMALVPLDHVWVDANFKETMIGQMRIGQPVTLTSDVYGGSVVYHGHVQGLGIGTGSAFALLPAQNATGNWIKIVQRLPVRIRPGSGRARQAPAARRPVDVGRGQSARPERRDAGQPAAKQTGAANHGVRRPGARRRCADRAHHPQQRRVRHGACRSRPTRQAGLSPRHERTAVPPCERGLDHVCPVAGHLHAGARPVDRQRVAADHRRRHRFDRHPGDLGDHLVHRGQRHRPAADRFPGQALR
ncbi:Secretion protein HlyD [mine drainage metagenome]|uniref:Secretion protein HlyD n=1 Tax=mine drainage metagenome TaxID=410659 RepID=T1AUE2_9ZZZZ